MNSSKIIFSKIVLRSMLFLFSFTLAYSNTSITPLTFNDIELISMESIGENSSLIGNLKESQAVQTFNSRISRQFGKLLFKEAQLATYTGGKQAIITPINNETKALMLISYLAGKNEGFKTHMVFEIASHAKGEAEAFTGQLAFYDVDGSLIYGVVYKNGELNRELNSVNRSNRGTNWPCIASCLRGFYRTNIGKWCKKKCLKCFSNPKWLSCFACAGCLIGGTAYCVWKCHKGSGNGSNGGSGGTGNDCKSNALPKINGKTSKTLQVCPREKIILDGSASKRCNNNKYFISVEEADAYWNRKGGEVSQWQSSSVIDVKAFSASKGLYMQPGKYYRVKLAVGNPWHSETILVYIKPSCGHVIDKGDTKKQLNPDKIKPDPKLKKF